MKSLESITMSIVAAALIIVASIAPTARAQEFPTNGSIESSIGKLDIINGNPSDANVAKLYDTLDPHRAVNAYLWPLPYVSMDQFRKKQGIKFVKAWVLPDIAKMK